jgi:hypothetical protein
MRHRETGHSAFFLYKNLHETLLTEYQLELDEILSLPLTLSILTVSENSLPLSVNIKNSSVRRSKEICRKSR